MGKKFILVVEYGTGKVGMLTTTNDITIALEEFLSEYGRGLPDTKMYGLPNIIKAEIFPVVFNRIKGE